MIIRDVMHAIITDTNIKRLLLMLSAHLLPIFLVNRMRSREVNRWHCVHRGKIEASDAATVTISIRLNVRVFKTFHPIVQM
jgi:hypothetical protein